jgi:hypothetical protein
LTRKGCGYFAHTGFNSSFLALMMGSKTGGNGVVIMSPADRASFAWRFHLIDHRHQLRDARPPLHR